MKKFMLPMPEWSAVQGSIPTVRLRNAENFPTQIPLQDEFQKAVAQQKRILRTQRGKLPEVNKHVVRAEKKVRWFEEKDANYEAMRAERQRLLKEIDSSASRLRAIKENLGRIEEAIAKLRNIFNLKVSNSTLKKVFHNLQFQNRSQTMRRERSLPAILLSSREKPQDEEPGERRTRQCAQRKRIVGYCFFSLPLGSP